MIKLVLDNVYVKVSVEPPFLMEKLTEEKKHDQWMRAANRLKDEIKRHCDDYEDLEIDIDTHYECSFCKTEMVAKDDYECCEESISEHDQGEMKNVL